MSWKFIKLNKAQCKHCGDTLISTDENPSETCTCTSLTVSGGSGYLGRTGTRGEDYKEMSEMGFDKEVPIKDDVGDSNKLNQFKNWQEQIIRKK